MRQSFETELNDLHVHFSEMGMMVNEAVHKSVKAFINHDKDLARSVIEEDTLINSREADLEQKCIELIALQQPVTSDLRKIITVMKASADLERMADHAVSISKSTIRVKGNKRVPEIEASIAELAEKVKSSVEEGLEAYLKYNIEKAKEVAARDKGIDQAAHMITEKCIEDMKQNPKLAIGATDYILVTAYLERIGDYLTNICEWVIYHETGKVVELNPKNKEI